MLIFGYFHQTSIYMYYNHLILVIISSIKTIEAYSHNRNARELNLKKKKTPLYPVFFFSLFWFTPDGVYTTYEYQ